MSACQGITDQSSEDMAFNTGLLLTIIFSYGYQIHCMRARSSNLGLSPYFVLFNTFFANTQYSNFLILSCYRFPILSCIGTRELGGLAAYSAVLGLLQAAIIWLGSIMLLVAYALYSFPRTRITSIFLPLLAAIHTVIILGHTALIDLPNHRLPKDQSLSISYLASSIGRSHGRTMRDPFSLYHLIGALGVQISWSMKPQPLPSRDSTPHSALALQALCFIAVGASWLVRLCGATTAAADEAVAPSVLAMPSLSAGVRGLWRWYASWGWVWATWAIYGAGLGLLAGVGWWFAEEGEKDRDRREGERYVLLGEV